MPAANNDTLTEQIWSNQQIITSPSLSENLHCPRDNSVVKDATMQPTTARVNTKQSPFSVHSNKFYAL